MIATVLQTVLGIASDVAKTAIFPKIMLAAIGAIVLAFGVQSYRISSLKNSLLKCENTYVQHLLEDERAQTLANRENAERQQRHTAELASLHDQWRAEREQMQQQNDVLRRDLASGARRVRPEICAAVHAGRSDPAAAPSVAFGEAEPQPDGADRLARAVGAAAACDADYAELLAIAKADRKLVGVVE